MDATGGDLSHAAIEVDEKLEKRSIHSSGSFDKEIGANEKEQGIRNSSRNSGQNSGSSTQDFKELHKLDSTIKVKEAKEGDEIYAHLPEHEREILKRQLDIPPISVSFKTLFRYATRNDQMIIFVSAICAIAGGAALPLMTVSYNSRGIQTTASRLTVSDYLRSTGRHISRLFRRTD